MELMRCKTNYRLEALEASLQITLNKCKVTSGIHLGGLKFRNIKVPLQIDYSSWIFVHLKAKNRSQILSRWPNATKRMKKFPQLLPPSKCMIFKTQSTLNLQNKSHIKYYIQHTNETKKLSIKLSRKP